jgi:protein-L-isoaspartate(D-aspartate) O-methyltransferase
MDIFMKKIKALVALTLLAGLMMLTSLGAGVGAARSPDGFEDARQAMVARQLQRRDITDPRVLIAMGTVPRHRFVPAAQVSRAYGDYPLPIGEDQTISQPYIVALMTQWAEVAPGDKVLEVGTGSGYQAAVLAELTEKVYSIEIRPDLARQAAARLKDLGYGRVQVRSGDGYQGWPEAAPFDAILVTAAAPQVPPALATQLKEGGRLVIPLGPSGGAQTLMRYRRVQGKLVEEASLPVRFVPLVHPPALKTAPGAGPAESPAANPGSGAPGR